MKRAILYTVWLLVLAACAGDLEVVAPDAAEIDTVIIICRPGDACASEPAPNLDNPLPGPGDDPGTGTETGGGRACSANEPCIQRCLAGRARRRADCAASYACQHADPRDPEDSNNTTCGHCYTHAEGQYWYCTRYVCDCGSVYYPQ